MRVAVRFAYDGARFDAYPPAQGRRTTEGALQEALGPEGLVARSWRTGSRTDRGVSALENVAACTLDRRHLQGVVPATQRRLPDGVWITGAAQVPEEWDPRRAMRTYRYDAAGHGEDLEAMRAACACFVGRHDLSGFARVEHPRDPMRTIEAFDVRAHGDGWLFRCQSPGFLWNQVRRMVAATLEVGKGRLDVAHIERALAVGAPPPRAELAPAAGLLLESVAYPSQPAWGEGGRVDARRLVGPLAAARHRVAVLEHVGGCHEAPQAP